MIKFIIFDLGKVILDFDTNIISLKLAKTCSHTQDEIHNYIFRSGIESQFDNGQISSENFFLKIKVKFSMPISYSDFSVIWCDIFQRVDKKIDLLIRKLCQKYRLGLLSNTNSLHFEFIMKNFPVVSYFRDFHLSYRLGFAKPEKEIFLKILQFYNCKPEEVFYVDDIEKNVLAAKLSGLCAFHFNGIDSLIQNLDKSGVSF